MRVHYDDINLDPLVAVTPICRVGYFPWGSFKGPILLHYFVTYLVKETGGSSARPPEIIRQNQVYQSPDVRYLRARRMSGNPA